jgi:hypothetical protein
MPWEQYLGDGFVEMAAVVPRQSSPSPRARSPRRTRSRQADTSAGRGDRQRSCSRSSRASSRSSRSSNSSRVSLRRSSSRQFEEQAEGDHARLHHRTTSQMIHPAVAAWLAAGESAIKFPSPLNVLEDTYAHSC